MSPPEASATAKRSCNRTISQSEFELEHGTKWKDSYTGNKYGVEGHLFSSTAAADSKPCFQPDNSEEHLRGEEAHNRNAGIWKSTSVTISHDIA